jgi:hypothetical protein
MIIKTAHNSGLWTEVGTDAFNRNVKRMRQDGRTIVTRTELTSADSTKHLKIRNDGWGVYHPITKYGPANCAIEWDQSVWKRLDKGYLELTDIRIKTKKGFLQPPSILVWVVLEHRRTGLEVLVSVAHHNLDNTPLRAQAWREEGATLVAFHKASARKHPKRKRIHQGDLNKNWRETDERNAVMAHYVAPGMMNAWKTGIPARGGTHGPRGLIDHIITDGVGTCRLLQDDGSSDHRPIEGRIIV